MTLHLDVIVFNLQQVDTNDNMWSLKRTIYQVNRSHLVFVLDLSLCQREVTMWIVNNTGQREATQH